MKLAYFPGCQISFAQREYGQCVEAIMDALGVTLVKLPFNCCGNPVRDSDLETSLYASLRNLALAREAGLNILTPCKCCFGQFQHAIYHWNTRDDVRDSLRARLTDEGLNWDGSTGVRHLLNFLHQDFGVDALAERVKEKQAGVLRVLQYGCHALRPSGVTQFDNPHAPRIFEDLMAALGAPAVPWSKATECCGNPVATLNPELSRSLAAKKMEVAHGVGASEIVTACTHCQMQYENLGEGPVKAITFAHILARALGITPPLV